MHSHTKFGIPTLNDKRDMLHILYKFTVKQTWYAALCHPKIHTYIQIWNSYLKEYKSYAMDTIILKTRSEIKVKMTYK